MRRKTEEGRKTETHVQDLDQLRVVVRVVIDLLPDRLLGVVAAVFLDSLLGAVDLVDDAGSNIAGETSQVLNAEPRLDLSPVSRREIGKEGAGAGHGDQGSESCQSHVGSTGASMGESAKDGNAFELYRDRRPARGYESVARGERGENAWSTAQWSIAGLERRHFRSFPASMMSTHRIPQSNTL